MTGRFQGIFRKLANGNAPSASPEADPRRTTDPDQLIRIKARPGVVVQEDRP